MSNTDQENETNGKAASQSSDEGSEIFENVARSGRGRERSPERSSARKGAMNDEQEAEAFIGFKLNPQMKRRFKDACEANSISMSIALRRFLLFYINNWEAGERPLYLLEEIGEGTT